MSTRPSLAAEPRTVTGKKVATLRRAGVLPAVVFGAGMESLNVQVSALDWEILRRGSVTRNTLLDLVVEGAKPRPVLVKHIAENPVSRKPVHIDFHMVKMTEAMTVDVPLVLSGEAPAVDQLGGTLLHLRETIVLRALPADLPTSIEADVSGLSDFDSTLHVSDLTVPTGVTVLTDPSEPIARVMAPRVEVEETAEPDLSEGAPEEAPEEAPGSAAPTQES